MRIDVGTVRLDGTADSDGTMWFLEKIEGWDAAEESLETIDPTGRHGQVLAAHQYRSRPLVLTGATFATTEANMWKAHNHLAALVGVGSPTTLTVYESVTKTLDVIRGGKPNAEIKSATWFRWQFSLRGLNPFKRGATHTVTIAAGGSATITYIGTAPGFPTITLTSGGTVNVANAATSTGVQTSSLASGAVIDTYARTVYAGTVNQYAALAPGVSWLTLQPGSNAVTNAGTADVSIQYYDLYL